MKKIGIIVDNIKDITEYGGLLGGEAVLINNVLKELIKRKYEIIIFTQINSYKDIDNCTVIEIPYYWYDPKFLEKIKILAKEKDLNEILSLRGPVLLGKYFLQSHSIIHRIKNSPQIIQKIKTFLVRDNLNFQRGLHTAPNNNTKYISVSKIIKNDYVNNYNIPEENIKVIYPGCEEKYEQLPDIDNKNSCITFGIIASSSLNKRTHLFLLSAGIVKICGYNFKLKLIAPKYNKDFLLKFLINIFHFKNQIEILPKQSDMTDFYKNIDCYVLPSWNEAFGLVTLETMAMGKPCIVTSSAGSAEIINSENGFIFERKSIKDLINKIKSVIKLYDKDFEKYKKYRQKAFETSKKYTWKIFVDNILK